MDGVVKYLLKDEIKRFIDDEKEKYAKMVVEDFEREFGRYGRLRFVFEIDLILEYDGEVLHDIVK